MTGNHISELATVTGAEGIRSNRLLTDKVRVSSDYTQYGLRLSRKPVELSKRGFALQTIKLIIAISQNTVSP